jgi:hypothetical protein
MDCKSMPSVQRDGTQRQRRCGETGREITLASSLAEMIHRSVSSVITEPMPLFTTPSATPRDQGLGGKTHLLTVWQPFFHPLG